MLAVSTEKGFMPVVNRKNFKIIYDYEGGQTLSFEIATNDENYQFFYEENRIRYNDNEFKIKKKNQRKTKTSIVASLNMDEWKGNFYHQFHETYKLFTEIVNLIIPSGWIIEGAGSVTGRHTIDIEGGSAYDILMQCKSVYGIVFEYHVLKKTIKVVKPDMFQSRGLYITDELNLKNLEFKGDSSDFITRLYAFGKKTEEKDDDGNVTKISYVTFADINGGKSYVDNNEYSDQVIVGYWQDDRYTDSESLLNDAIDKLKSLSTPVRSYSCDLMDLSRINDKYRYLDFKLYDKVTLLDSISKIHVQHQIVEYVDYPDNRNNNSVSLCSVFKKITGTIDGIKQSISNIDTELLKKESTINEIIRDVKSNTLRINDTYTRGEVDNLKENIIQQTSEATNLSIQSLENKIGVYIDSIEPENKFKEMRWIDTSISPPVFKIFDGEGWIELGDYSSDITSLKGMINHNSNVIEQNKNEINALIEQTTVSFGGENISLKKYTENLKVDFDGITNILSKREGNNIIRDSIGCFDDGAWIGDYNIDSSNETRSRNMYGYALLLKKGILEQTNTVSNNEYTISFTYKKLVSLASVKVVINNTEFSLSNTEYTKFSYTFVVTSGFITIEFKSDTDNACPIINLMLNIGNEALQWSLNPNETWSDTVKIGRGVRISSSGTDVEFVAYADVIGFQDEQGNYITTFDSNGMVTNEIVVKNKARIVKLLIQDINGQTIINRLNDEEV